MSEWTPPSEEECADPGDGSASFEQALRDLARPPAVGGGLEAELRSRRPEQGLAEDSLLRAARAAQGERSLPSPGDLLDGHYRILSLLGQGGMGVVFAAENLRTGKEVAIKWIHLEGMDASRRASLIARFHREARAVAKVDHPHVVAVYDVGEADGTPFLVMERLHGESLRTRLERGALAWQEARSLILDVLRGVAAVHRAGVVHRDLKPDNIFLSRSADGTAVIPKVLDFGVAAMRERVPADMDSLTRTGAILGTPSYMPFEQLTGAEVDQRADVYAVGVMLYELLTKRLPFSSRSATELAVLQATSLPMRPSRYVPTLRGRAERAVLKALAKDPARRYASVEQFAHALESCERRAPARLAPGVFGLSVTLAVAASMLWQPRPVSQAPVRRDAPAKTTAEAFNVDQASQHSMEAPPPPSAEVTTSTEPAPDRKTKARTLGARRSSGARAQSDAVALDAGHAPGAETFRSPTRDPTSIGVDDF